MPSLPHAVAVLDLETTGLGPADRILEVGVVLLDRDLRQEAVWQTLVQPGRDIDNSHIHGVTATDVVDAPTFSGVAAELAELLDGRVLVAHNAPFDTRFLTAEYARLDVELPEADAWSQCTRALSRRLLPGAPQRLAQCLESVGLGNDRPHAALADARATADLYRALVLRHGAGQEAAAPLRLPAAVDTPRAVLCPRGQADPGHWLERISAAVPATGVPEVDEYRRLLRGALLDAALSRTETIQLLAAAEKAGLSRAEVDEVHLDYIRQLAVEAWADGVVTAAERARLHDVAVQLAVDPAAVDALLAEPVHGEVEDAGLRPGDRVAFTGALTLGRDTWEQRARAAGLQVGGVARATALVVAANPDTMSGKARKARDHGIPVVDETTFARMLHDLVPAGPAAREQSPAAHDFAGVFPWVSGLGVEPATVEDVAHAWLQRHRNAPLRELSPRLDPAEVPDSLPRTGAVVSRWLRLHPRPLDASLTQLADVPGFGRLRLHRTLVAVVHSALDAPEAPDHPAADAAELHLDDPQDRAPQGPVAAVQTAAEWLALLGRLPEPGRSQMPPSVARALDSLSQDLYWSDPATAAIHRARAEISARIGSDPRDLDIFRGRILGSQTLEEIAERHQVAREQVRRMETALKRRLVEPDDTIHLVLDALGQRFGPLTPVDGLRRELPALFDSGPVSDHPLLDTLAWLADDWEISDGWFQRAGFAGDLARALADFADEYGLAPLPAVAQNLGVDAQALRARLAGEATVHGGHILSHDRPARDRAAALLAVEGEPLSSGQIAERLGGVDPRTLIDAMSVDGRIVRVGRDRWGLRGWGIEEDPDPSGESREVEVDPEETAGLYRIGGDLVWLTTVTADHLRGSGSAIPRGLAAALEVPVPGERTLPGPLGGQTVGMSRTGGMIGDIRRFLAAAGIGEGERIWLTFTGDGGFDVQHATVRREGLGGIEEVFNATGLDTWFNPAHPEALGRLNRSVGLDPGAPRRRTVSRFRHRGQDELADLIAQL